MTTEKLLRLFSRYPPDVSRIIRAAERSLVPDFAIRWGVRRLLRKRLSDILGGGSLPLESWLQEMRESPVAIDTGVVNDQHYEVPAEFYKLCLGEHLKYSSCLWEAGGVGLSSAEEAMLRTTCERAQLEDGQNILELGCGWGSLSLWMAAHYPRSEIFSISNSASQRKYIESQAQLRGIENLKVGTVDINQFRPQGIYDRVVSVEMFEHMRNWEKLLGRVSRWLDPLGKVFLHYFSHSKVSYPFEDRGSGDWMARNFFTGGIMPCHDLPRRLEIPFEVEKDWRVSGTHYAMTSEAWLRNLDCKHSQALEILRRAGFEDPVDARRQLQKWRMFFIACSELFGFNHGNEWLVSHQLLRPVEGGMAS